MTGDSTHEPDEPSIGVGMGGSCPECRAPVDLAQEFCLECGAAIRFTAKPKQKPRATATNTTQTIIMPPKRGFPWVPFVIVLLLVIGGVAFAVFAGDDVSTTKGRSSSGSSTEGNALPKIESTRPEETSTTSTTTLQDCISTTEGLDLQPAVTDSSIDPLTGQPAVTSTESATGQEIPVLTESGATPIDTLGADGTFDDGMGSTDPSAVPSTEPGDPNTVTVDQNGNLCPPSGSTGDTQITDTGATDTSAADPTGSGWPAGKSGFTVVLLGFAEGDGYTEADANSRSVEAQSAGLNETGVLNSADFTSLCPGFWVVFDGTFDKRSQAEAELEVAKDAGYAAAYVRAINNSETADCSSR